MANDTRSSRRVKVDESNSEKGAANGKTSSNSCSGSADTLGLRRSSRETLSRKQITSSPSSTRKSERLEKRTLLTPPVKKKSDRNERPGVPSPLRRSDRGKKYATSSSSGSSKSEKVSSSLNVKQRKEKKEKSVKQLTKETREVRRSVKRDIDPIGIKRKTMNGRTYKALLKMQKRRSAARDDDDNELDRPDTLLHADSSNKGGGGSKQVVDADDEVHECGVSNANQKHQISEKSHECSDRGKIKASESCNMVKEIANSKGHMLNQPRTGELPSSKSVDSAPTARTPAGDTYVESGDKALPSKRKRNAMDTDFVANKDICTSIADDVSLQPEFVGVCVVCAKCRRIDFDARKQELCSCKTTLNKDFSNTTNSKETSMDIQMDSLENVCVVCKLGGKLLCCDGKGCKRCYHPSCLDPPEDDIPAGAWHCHWCVKKKIESGVHSVSGRVESIWDVREVEVSDAKGLRSQKQYLVKYEGLAHIHNHWVPESHLLVEVPLLVSKFNRKNQATIWNVEWIIAHRLLKKRLGMPPKQRDEYQSGHAGNFSDGHYEWLVKWRGLDYEHATWELENSSFLCSPHGQNLMREYENRRDRARRAVGLVEKSKKGSSVKLSELPAMALPGTDVNMLNAVNRLRDCWHKSQHAIIFDEKERIMKVVLFILSLYDEYQPFLIITTSSALSHWETEFMRLAPSIDVIVYNGNGDSRQCLRTLEFQEEGGCLMLQVLLSSVETVAEDLETLGALKWEAVIIDECQLPRISAHLKQIKMLMTDCRVLLFNGQMKDTVADYLNLLSLLDSDNDIHSSGGLMSYFNNDLGKLKERLSRFIAYDRNSNFSRFVEYWVPVQISNVQLEQYCATLLSNSISLCLCSKNDPVGALRDVLISTRKCCDHPYIVDPSLQGLITKGLPLVDYLAVGVNASGKLQLLDTMLSEIKNRQLRVLILFQSASGSGRDSIGDILDDFLRQRFGQDSYERVDGGVIPSKKQAALNKFNKESGRFVFLLESRACLPSIKLSSVDTVIIFGSDWNPANDLKALNKISIESQFRQIMVFRFYTAFTVEEKLLILNKKVLTLDSNLLNISRSLSDSLLMWGASFLFSKLDEFHGSDSLDSCGNTSSERSLLNDVVKEFLGILSQSDKNNDAGCFIISKVHHNRGAYNANLPLVGELKIQLTEEEPPHFSWTKLLGERNPRWKYLSGSTHRNRKRVHYLDESPKKSEVQSDEVGKKRKKGLNNYADAASLQPRRDEGEVALTKEGAGIPANVVESEEGTLSDAQKGLHQRLKPEISKLCDVLKLPEDAKVMVERFLEYIIKNHRVNEEPATILQAFQISMCWTGASLLKHKIDKKNSLVLAKQHLNFSCKEEEANYIYSRLRLLKKQFLYESENVKDSNSSRDTISAAEDIMKGPLDSRMSLSMAFNVENVKIEIEERSQDQDLSDELVLLQQERTPKNTVTEKGNVRSVRKFQKICEKQMTILVQKQGEEIQEFHRIWDEKKVQLEGQHKLESALVRSIHSYRPLRMDRLKMLDDEFAKKMDEHTRNKQMQLKDLEAKQLALRNEQEQKAAHWIAEMQSCAIENGAHDGLSLCGSESGNRVRDFHSECTADSGTPKAACVSGHLVVECYPDESVHDIEASEVARSDLPKTFSDAAIGCSTPTEPSNSPINPSSKNDAVEMIPLKSASVVAIEQLNEVECSSNGSKHVACTNLPISEEQADGVLSSMRGEDIRSKMPETAINELVEHIESMEVRTPAVTSIGENLRADAIASDLPNALRNLNDVANISIDDSSPLEELTGKSPLTQPVVSEACDFSCPQIPVAKSKHPQSPTPAEVQNVDSPPGGNKCTLLQVEVPSLLPSASELTVMPNIEGPTIESRVLSCLSSPTSLPLSHRQPPASGVADLPCSERNAFSQNSLSTQLVQDVAELSHQVVTQTASGLDPHLSIDATDVVVEHNQPDLRSAGRDINQPYGDQNFPNGVASTLPPATNDATDPSQGNNQPDVRSVSEERILPSVASPQLFENAEEFLNQFTLQPGASLVVCQGPSCLPMDTADQATSHMPTLSVFADPLQNELERIRKETEQTMKFHEDMKLRLKSECDKEIESTIAQIHRKFDAKLKEAEAGFLLKKNELDTNHNKVLMNKILAQAFRSKCWDLSPSGTIGTREGIFNSFMQRMGHLSLQSSVRPFPVTAWSSVSQPAGSEQITTASLMSHHPTASCSSTLTRPAHISPITPSTGNLRASRDVRAPAPHLQRFRSSASPSACNVTSVPVGFPSQQASCDLLFTSLPLSFFPPLPPSLQPTQPLLATQSPVESAGQVPAPHNSLPFFPPLPPAPRLLATSSPIESAGWVPAPHNLSLSAMELLLDVDNRASANRSLVFPQPPDCISKVDSLNLSDLGMSGTVRDALGLSSVGTDVVCLSDDD